mmetsp:Transcript_15952/g.24845  ORF Transcript_15952/g.24845 Transcript_15952/m.24845 type:complete len:107 (-) Transcript_15952:289-609(-)
MFTDFQKVTRWCLGLGFKSPWLKRCRIPARRIKVSSGLEFVEWFATQENGSHEHRDGWYGSKIPASRISFSLLSSLWASVRLPVTFISTSALGTLNCSALDLPPEL